MSYSNCLLAMAVVPILSFAARAGDFRDLLEKRTFKGSGDEKLHYRLLAPEKVDDKTTYPLVVFLHGAGERGDDNNKQLVHGVAEFAKPENRTKYPCYLIAPQCPIGKSWASFTRNAKSDAADKPAESLRLTLDLVAALQKEFPIDAKRIYITGLSMGGFGTWDALARKPELFAAAVPICGGGDEKRVEGYAKLPIWVFHGAKDTAVKVERSRTMVDALKKAGGSPKYTEYPEVGHDSWVKAYKDADMFAWLFSQKRK
jgi:predicted peptidase